MRVRMLVPVLAAALGIGMQADAAVLVGFDAAAAGAGVTPAGQGWTQYGTPMVNNGSFLLQDNTGDDPATSSGEYLSPTVAAGTMSLTSGQYGIEFRARPLTDVPFLGASHYANAYVWWADDSFAYNITIDKDTDDAGPGTTGGIKYGQNSLSDAVLGIDWSVPHTIFIGYTGTAPFGSFDFYVDGVFANTVSAGSIARTGSFARDAVDFGDGTTGQGLDVAVEWYFVNIHDTAVPEPTSLALLGLGGAAALGRRRA
ncbi:MAG: PEP-CTERM sorting domain-containing protein [Phycisphaerales bacterium]